jgi:hypothetical protein
MNPIKKFEAAAFKTYRSNADANEKAFRLTVLANAIENYLSRVKSRDLKDLDPWQHAKATRALEYLKLLQKDINTLAADCRKSATTAKVRARSVLNAAQTRASMS